MHDVHGVFYLSIEYEMPLARAALLGVGGPEAVVRAAACVGNFEMMNRLLDATGVRVTRDGMAVAREPGLDVPTHLHPLPLV